MEGRTRIVRYGHVVGAELLEELRGLLGQRLDERLAVSLQRILRLQS